MTLRGKLKVTCPYKSFERLEEFKYSEQPYQFKSPFMKKLKTDCCHGMLAIIQCITFFSSSRLISRHITFTELQIFLLFCMGLKLGLSHRLRAYENRVLGKIFGP